MKIIDIFRLKINYFFNKNTIIILLLNIILIIFCFTLEAINIDKSLSKDETIYNYFINNIFYLKIFITFLSLYIFSLSISFKNDFLIYLLIPLGVKRDKSISLTIIINIIFLFLFELILFIFYSYLGLFLNEFKIYDYMIFGFINVLFTSIIYGLYTMILNQIFNNYFVIISVMTIYILMNNLIDSEINNIFKIIFILLPALNGVGEYQYNFLYLIILIIVLFIINVYIYKKRDLNF